MKKWIILFVLTICLCTACGATDSDTVDTEKEENVVIMPSDEIYTVLDVRETRYKGSTFKRKEIIVVLENTKGERAAFEYVYLATENESSSNNYTYKNLQILIPGDKVICVDTNEFKIIKE